MSGHGGKRPGAGRPKGSKGARTKQVEELLESLDCNPIEGLVRLARLAEEDAQAAPTPSERVPHINIAKDCYKELAQYVAPKRKSVEMDATVDVGTHESWLENLK